MKGAGTYVGIVVRRFARFVPFCRDHQLASGGIFRIAEDLLEVEFLAHRSLVQKTM